MPLNLLLSLHDEVFEALIADFLVFCNYEVTAAYTQNDTINYCKDNAFDIALIDVSDEKDIELIKYCLTLKPDLGISALVHNEVSEQMCKAIPLPKNQQLALPLPLVDILESIKVLDDSLKSAKLKTLTPITLGSLCINKQNQTASVHGKTLALTLTEFTLLNLLVQNINTPVSKDDIYPKVLGRPRGQYDRAIDVHISSVRHKLQQLGCEDVYIESVRGIGYQLKKRQISEND